jgi:nitrogen fixation protein FixH
MNTESKPPPSTPTWKLDSWAIAIIVFFLIVFAANAVLVILGQQSWPGLVTENHYQKGLEYNQVIAAQKKQEKLGWQIRLLNDPLFSEKPGLLSVMLTGREGKPIENASVEGVLFRPLGEGSDQPFLMRQAKPGLYTTTITPPKPGEWDIKIRAKTTAKSDFRYVERITVGSTQNKETH